MRLTLVVLVPRADLEELGQLGLELMAGNF